MATGVVSWMLSERIMGALRVTHRVAVRKGMSEKVDTRAGEGPARWGAPGATGGPACCPRAASGMPAPLIARVVRSDRSHGRRVGHAFNDRGGLRRRRLRATLCADRGCRRETLRGSKCPRAGVNRSGSLHPGAREAGHDAEFRVCRNGPARPGLGRRGWCGGGCVAKPMKWRLSRNPAADSRPKFEPGTEPGRLTRP
jgi:hypothetical protein